MRSSTRLLRRSLPFVGVLSFACAGCMENTSGDMALLEIQKIRAESRATEARLAAMEGRQMYVAQQVSMLAGVIGEVGREAGARAEAFAKRQEEIARQVEQAERAAAAERERVRVVAESPQTVAARAQGMIDAGQIKATVKNGKTRLDVVDPAGAGTTPAPAKSAELEDPWAAQRKPTVPAVAPTAGSAAGKPPVPPAPPAAGSAAGKPAGRRMSDDLGF